MSRGLDGSLAEYVKRIMHEKRLSSYDVEARSLKSISQSTVNRIQTGHVLSPSPSKLQALAKGLGVVEEEIFAVVRKKAPDLSVLGQEKVNSLVARLERVRPHQREYALNLIGLLERELDRLADID